MKNGFLGAIYDGLEATVDTVVDAVRGHTTWEALERAEDREDRALLRAGYDPDFVAARREHLLAESREAHIYDLHVDHLRDIGWRRADLESVLERYDEIDVHDLYHDDALPEDFGFERIPDVFTDHRGALSLAPEGHQHGACSLAEPTVDAPDLGDALER